MSEEERFLSALDWLWPIEGGWYDGGDARDRHPTMYGITQTTYTGAGYGGSVRNITKRQAIDIYWKLYWRAAKCGDLSWPLGLVHFDAAVNHGVGRAKKMLGVADSSWRGYIAARRAFYADLIRRRPAMKANERGWENRMVFLTKRCQKEEETSQDEQKHMGCGRTGGAAGVGDHSRYVRLREGSQSEREG